jgi:hypothetical protein
MADALGFTYDVPCAFTAPRDSRSQLPLLLYLRIPPRVTNVRVLWNE